ncbi:MAG: carboxypeptidase-like regulatory domain-containing protein, partial [Treponema sp.]|nr:carboxypeptidase-like regulatory domain-containing protein [Treponema sp.]
IAIEPLSSETESRLYFISGVIASREGGYADGAEIQLYSGSAKYGNSVIANSGGRYTIYGVANGSYSIKVALAGYNPAVISDVVVKDANKTDVDGSIIKTYYKGGRGPAGGWIVYVGNEHTNLYYGFTYIELAPNDIGPNDGKLHFGSIRNTEYFSTIYDSMENTQYILKEYNNSMGGDIVEIEGAAVFCTEYTLNGYKDWVLPTSGVFEMIKNDGNYSGYNFKLNEQYWCSDSVLWQQTQWWTEFDDWDFLHLNPHERSETYDVEGVMKFRFEPELITHTGDTWNFCATNDYALQLYVRPVRYF